MRLMKYLIETKNFSYLFGAFYSMIRPIPCLQSEFFSSLTPFVKLQQITLFPSSDAFTDLLKQKPPVDPRIIHSLIFNLKQPQDFSFITDACERNEEMITPFFYLCTRISKKTNFSSPLSHMMSSY